MATCYEKLKAKTKKDNQIFYRLNSYFFALENDNLIEYHRKHGRDKE